MAERRRDGFTLIELLVVITIIVILMSILLPALKYAKSVAGQGACARQIRKVNEAFHAYLNEWDGRLPWVASHANLHTYQTIGGYDGQPSGFGVLYDTKLIEEGKIFYCPTAEVIFGEPETRQNYMENFAGLFEQCKVQYGFLRCDYIIGYWIEPYWGPYPTRLGTNREGDKFETYKKDRVCWMADTKDVMWWRSYHPASHERWRLMNVGMVDGSVRAIIDYMMKLPQKGRYGYYWPNNDRPMWGWWEYYGVGEGL